MIHILAGSTSQSIDVFIPSSASTTGAGLTGLVFNSASLTCYYRKGATGTATAVTLATQTVGGAYSSGGFVEIDATNMPGMYRFDIPNAAIDTAGLVHFLFKGATNMAPVPVRINCANIPVDVRAFGGTAGTFSSGRPEVNTTHLGGTTQTARDIGASVLLSSGTGTGQISLTSGLVTLAGVTHTGAVIPTVTTTTTATNLTNLPSIPANWLTAAGIAADAITAAKVAADVGTEIGTAVWATTTRLLTAGTNIVLAKGTGVTGFNDLDAAGVAGAVWNAATASYGSAGSYGLLVETNIDATVSSRLASASYTAPLDAAGIRTAVGLGSANLDTQLSTIDTVVDSILADTGTDGVVVASGSKSGYALSSSGVDAITIESGLNMRQATSIIAASAAGKLTGAATTTITIDGAGVNTDRIVATVDADGNRTAITLTPPA